MSQEPAVQMRIDRAAKKRLKESAKRLGIKQEVLAGRVLEWFARQHPDVQMVIAAKFTTQSAAMVMQMILAEVTGAKASKRGR